MGLALSMEVIAEGVETAEEQSLLTELHCQQAQGYLFSRPLKSELITADKIAQIKRNVCLVTEA